MLLFSFFPKTHDVKRRIYCHWLDAVPHYAAQNPSLPHITFRISPNDQRHNTISVTPERRIISILLFFYARFPENDEETGISSKTTCRCVFAAVFSDGGKLGKVCLRSAAIERPSRQEHRRVACPPACPPARGGGARDVRLHRRLAKARLSTWAETERARCPGRK